MAVIHPNELQSVKRDVQHASTLTSLKDALDITSKAKANVEHEADQFVSSGTLKQSHDLQRIDMLRAQLGAALVPSHDMSSSLGSASFAAHQLSSKVRNLDLEQSRITQALQYIEKVMTLKSCVLGVQDAMAARDWEHAAKFIHTAASLPSELVDGAFAKAMVPTSESPDYPRETLDAAARSLGDLFLREFGKAANAKDMDNVTRYFKLFPLIGQEAQGLDVYSKFVCGIITAQSRTILQNRGGDENLFYALAMSRLFENIATIISDHAPVVNKHYGPGRMVRVLEKTQDEADSQGGLIIDTYWDERRLDRVLAEVQSYSYPFLVTSFTRVRPETPNVEEDHLKQVGNLIQECSIMLNRWNLYRIFIGQHWQEFSTGFSKHSTHQVLSLPPVIISSGFAEKIASKVAPSYETMALFMFRRSVEKAFQLDQLPEPGQNYSSELPLISSVVDDVMFMLSTVIDQVLQTGNLTLIQAVISDVRRILESDFIGCIQRKLRDEAPKPLSSGSGVTSRFGTPPGGTRSTASSAPTLVPGITIQDDRRLRNFLIYLNDLSVSADYADRIVSTVLPVAKENLVFEDDATNAEHILQTTARGFRARCDELVNDGIQVAFNQVVNIRLRTLYTNVFKDVEYMVSPDMGPVDISAAFAYEWDILVAGFSKAMSPTNFGRLVALLAGSLSRMLEKKVWSLQGKVNELGAIRLDRDISRIIAKVSDGRFKLRDKFVRVAQLVMILGMEEEDDDGISWILSEEEKARAKSIIVGR